MMHNKNNDFQEDYENHYIKNIKYIENKYPNITEENRRTGKALKNICFFIWNYAKDESSEVVDLLFKSSVLLSAQDDFCDSLNIADSVKNKFYTTCERTINGETVDLSDESQQFVELVKLWEEINQEVRKSPPYLYEHWKKESIKLNVAMMEEGQILRKKEISLDDYIKVAVNSIGITFIWANYFTKKDISEEELEEIKPVLALGARVVRLSNDIASYRRKKNKINVVTIIKGVKSPQKYILNLMEKEHNKFNKDLLKTEIGNELKQVIKKSVDFLESFYRTSDFDQ
jgi:hypothetical protein